MPPPTPTPTAQDLHQDVRHTSTTGTMPIAHRRVAVVHEIPSRPNPRATPILRCCTRERDARQMRYGNQRRAKESGRCLYLLPRSGIALNWPLWNRHRAPPRTLGIHYHHPRRIDAVTGAVKVRRYVAAG